MSAPGSTLTSSRISPSSSSSSTYPNENCTPGTTAGRCSVSAPGRTCTSSVSRLKQPCLVFILFSRSCLWTAFIICGICTWSCETGLKIKRAPRELSMIDSQRSREVCALNIKHRACFSRPTFFKEMLPKKEDEFTLKLKIFWILIVLDTKFWLHKRVTTQFRKFSLNEYEFLNLGMNFCQHKPEHSIY